MQRMTFIAYDLYVIRYEGIYNQMKHGGDSNILQSIRVR